MHQERLSIQQLSGQKLLLHSCCAPCSGSIMADLKSAKIEFTVFYYNPNIHPYSEYKKRKTENKKYAEKLKIPFIDADYSDKSKWFDLTHGL